MVVRCDHRIKFILKVFLAPLLVPFGFYSNLTEIIRISICDSTVLNIYKCFLDTSDIATDLNPKYKHSFEGFYLVLIVKTVRGI